MPLDHLDGSHHHLPQFVDRVGLGPRNHVVARHVLGRYHTVDPVHLAGHLSGLAHLGLDEMYALDCHRASLVPAGRWRIVVRVVRNAPVARLDMLWWGPRRPGASRAP